MKFTKKDQLIIAEAYASIYMTESMLPNNIKVGIDNFINKYGKKVIDLLKNKFPDFYNKLVNTGGDQNAIRNLVTPLVQNQSNTLQEGFISDFANKSRDALSKLFSYANISRLLTHLGVILLSASDIQVKGSGVDKDLLIMGLVTFFTGLYAIYLNYQEKNRD